jgi:glutamine synthetase
MGYKPFFSQEFEWFNFREDSDSLKEKGFANLQPLTPGMFGYSIVRSSQNSEFFTDLFDLLEDFDVPIEGLHTETGPGVYEAAILYSDILTAADRAVLFKTGVKEIAHLHGIMPTFMAKISPSLPGCSGHVHQSLWDIKAKKNLFFDAKGRKKYEQGDGELHGGPTALPAAHPADDRTHHQQLQALGGRRMGTHHTHLGDRQPHRGPARLARRREEL